MAGETGKPGLGVRVRGIYSTAITQLLLSRAISIADPTEPIRERFPELVPAEAAGVTVKDRDDKHALIVLGLDPLFSEVTAAIRGEIKWSIYREAPLGYFSSYKCRVLRKTRGGYEVELPDGLKGLLRTESVLREGELVNAHVIAPLVNPPILSPGIAVVGVYARLIEGGRFSCSRFIRSASRIAELMALSSRMVGEGWGVRWRSNASKADITVLMEELERLKRETEKAEEAARESTGPRQLTEGERLATLMLPLQAKLEMDRVRNRRRRTITLHHHLKTLGPDVSRMVDLLEESFTCCDEDCLGLSLHQYYVKKLCSGGAKRARFVHEKPDGSVIEIRGDVASIGKDGLLKVNRTIKSPGVYDGLGVEKEAGDVAVSVTSVFSPIIVHKYMDREGRVKGYYVNVNTPLEVSRELAGVTAWYIDLEVDVVVGSDGAVAVRDAEELKRLVSAGVVPSHVAAWAFKVVDYVKSHAELLTAGREDDVVREAVKLFSMRFPEGD